MIPQDEYLDFFRGEYLTRFIREGGAAVKFLVFADEDAEALHEGLRARAGAEGYVYARVDSAVTRLQMSNQVFFAVARQLDWDDVACRFLRQVLPSAGVEVSAGQSDMHLAGLAARNGLDLVELTREVKKLLVAQVYRDAGMIQEMRVAMMRLCLHALGTGDTSDVEHTAILEWLTGELKRIADLRSALIFRRVARNNARAMLFSTVHWLHLAGYAGLVLNLDLRRLAVARRPPVSQQTGLHYYTKSAAMDVFESLRQLVDATDEMEHCCAVVTAGPEFLTDDDRGLSAYHALQLRVWDDVRDRRRDNPYSSLVRLVEIA